MQRANYKKSTLGLLAFTFLFFTLLAGRAEAGLDTYAIYLNNKLILKQAVNQPVNLQGLQLQNAAPGDQLVIYYSECRSPNKIGTARTLLVQDNNGNTLKEWKYANVTGTDKGMTIPVKELLELKKRSTGNLTLVYAATMLPKGQLLTGVQFK